MKRSCMIEPVDGRGSAAARDACSTDQSDEGSVCKADGRDIRLTHNQSDGGRLTGFQPAHRGIGGGFRACWQADASSRCLWAGRLEGNSHFFSAHEGAPDIPILGTGIERDQSIAMLAVRLKAVAKILRPLSKHHRAFGAFDFDLVINHG